MNPSKGIRQRISLRVPLELHKRIEVAAKASGLDVNTYLCEVLDKAVKGKKYA